MKRHAMLVLVVATMAMGCGDRECRGSADATIDTLIPDGQEVHCVDSEEFEADGRTVRFTHVEYGALRDCPSGCFSSHVCAIEDGDGVELYSAHWYDESEEPLGIDEECTADLNMDTRECDVSGASHPLTETDAFAEFSAEAEGGPFRWCFN